ncbi:hypothetical protein EDC32_1011344 [Laceyella sacchari]|jgi:hypothetical protein|nr:hypothetical protein EDC32_1011344 [Laceyella sacchari]
MFKWMSCSHSILKQSRIVTSEHREAALKFLALLRHEVDLSPELHVAQNYGVSRMREGQEKIKS